MPFEVDLVDDGRTEILGNLQSGAPIDSQQPQYAAEEFEAVDFRKMNAVRPRIDEAVRDPAVAEQGKP